MSEKISRAVPRFDGREKAEGKAAYIRDIPLPGSLYARFYRSPVSRGIIRKAVFPEMPEGYYLVDRHDVTGENRIALIKLDWPVFAEEEVRYIGQIMYLVAGPDPAVVEDLVSRIRVEFREMPPAVSLDESMAMKGGPIHGEDNLYARYDLVKGDPDGAFARADRIIEGVYETGFQEQLYMEPQGLTALREGERITIHGSLQCPYYVKHAVRTALGLGPDQVRVVQSVVGGGFGGKEDYPEIMGSALAVAAWKIGKPLRLFLDRREDMAFTSKRHPSRTRVRTAHDRQGRILALDYQIHLDGGAYESYSAIVLQRAVFASNGVYNFPAARVSGRAWATNTVPSGAFRGFGAPQAVFAIETHMDRVVRELGADPVEYRRPLLLKQGDPTITRGTIHDPVILEEMIDKIDALSDFRRKRESYKTLAGRGIGISVFSHGCGFTGNGEQALIKGRVRMRKDPADRVEILAASVDMGQGCQTTFRKVAAEVLGLDYRDILFALPDTDRVPDSGPTVASRTMMIVGGLVEQAAEKLKGIWKPGEAQEVEAAYAMPEGLSWDQENLTGDAYPAFSWAVNVVEVEVDPLTLETRVIGSWAVCEVGRAIDDRVVCGQIQGGMSQALGYACLEKLEVDGRGRFRQATMADYIIPTSMDFPRTEARTADNPWEHGPFGAKGLGELVHDGGHAAYVAAVSQALDRQCSRIPLTPELLLKEMNP